LYRKQRHVTDDWLDQRYVLEYVKRDAENISALLVDNAFLSYYTKKGQPDGCTTDVNFEYLPVKPACSSSLVLKVVDHTGELNCDVLDACDTSAFFTWNAIGDGEYGPCTAFPRITKIKKYVKIEYLDYNPPYDDEVRGSASSLQYNARTATNNTLAHKYLSPLPDVLMYTTNVSIVLVHLPGPPAVLQRFGLHERMGIHFVRTR
jgi:hypothetical protein